MNDILESSYELFWQAKFLRWVNRIHLTNLFDTIIYEEHFNINIGRGFKTLVAIWMVVHISRNFKSYFGCADSKHKTELKKHTIQNLRTLLQRSRLIVNYSGVPFAELFFASKH